MNIAAYLRVSTDRQADKGYSLSEQEKRIKAFCNSRDWDLIKVYKDPGFTGSNLERPGLQKLIEEIDAYDIVLVNKLDRLSRSQKDTLYLIQDVFAPHNCNFVSIEESFDTTTALGIAMVGILSAFAQLERSQIKERLKMGKEGRKKKGLWHGGHYIPIGYDYVDGQLKINDEAEQVKLIFQMFLNGASIRSIARHLNQNYTTRYTSWNYVGTVRRVLANPVYIGMVGEYKGQHEPIIDKDTFEKVQVILDERKRGGKTPTGKHLLTGMIFCGYCGARVGAVVTFNKKFQKKYSYYRCGCVDRQQLDKYKASCELTPKREEEIDNAVISEILKINPSDIVIKQDTPNIIDNSSEIEKIDKQIKRLINLYAICGEDVEELAQKIKALKEKKLSLQKLPKKPQKAKKEHILESLNLAKTVLIDGTVEDKRKIADALISSVYLYNDHIEIHWKF